MDYAGVSEEEQLVDKSPDAFRTISEVAEDLDLPQHVLRFWETRFSQIKPMKRGGGRRYYRPDDVALITGLKTLLYGQGYTIKGVQRILKEQGAKSVQAVGRGGALPLAAPVTDFSGVTTRPVGTDVKEISAPVLRPDTMQSAVATPAAARPPISPTGQGTKALSQDDQSALRQALAELGAARADLARALSRQLSE